jgi:riboflavin kinase / FMN adenylyltransferase
MIDDLEGLPIDGLPRIGPAAICMGVFDGVHRGHRRLVAATRAAARDRGVASVALVFDPHPDQVIREGLVVPRLAPLGVNLRWLHEAGIDAALPVRFDAALRSLMPAEFLAAMHPAVPVRALVMTPDSAFGRGRSGTADAMREHGLQVGFDLVLAGQELDDGRPISSARVRAALADGDIAQAARLLGHPPYLEGRPRAGAATELILTYPAAIPAPGRYSAEALSGGHRRAVELTVGDDGRVSLTWPGGTPPVARGVLSLELGEHLQEHRPEHG